jgi:hypothetical protein
LIRYDGKLVKIDESIKYNPYIVFGVNSSFNLELGDLITTLVDTNIPLGLKSSSTQYGLVRKATADELNQLDGDGYLAPPDLSFLTNDLTVLSSNLTGLSNFVNNSTVKTTGTQSISGIKTFSASPKVPNGVVGLDAVNFDQLLSSMIQTYNNKIILPGGLVITWGSIPTPPGGQGAGGGAIAYYNHTYINIPFVYANCTSSAPYSHVNVNSRSNSSCNLTGWTSYSDAVSIPAQQWSWFAIGY